jgi:DNA-binding MarR family transcriptional regulator
MREFESHDGTTWTARVHDGSAMPASLLSRVGWDLILFVPSPAAEQRFVYRPAGWSHAGFRICIALWVMGPIPSHQVTAMTNMGRATVSAALKRISEEGLVTKEPSTDDARSVMVRLTPEGERAIRESYAWHLQIEHEWFDVLTEIEKQVLLMLLDKLMQNRPRR